MAAQPGTPAGMNPDEMRQMWETGSRSLLEGFRQAQEFWNNTARSVGEVTGAWTAQLPRSGAGISAEGEALVRAGETLRPGGGPRA